MERTRRVAEKLSQKVGTRENDDPVEVPADRLLDGLLQEYEDVSVENATGCIPTDTPYGEVYHRVETVTNPLRTPSRGDEAALRDLTLLHGIGPARQQSLKEEGYRSIRDLASHRKYAGRAEEFLDGFDACRRTALDLVARWKPASHPAVLGLASRFDPEEFAIVDIETLGLTNQPVILIGAALPSGDSVELHQFLLKDIHQETAALTGFIDQIQDREAVMSFNGRTFDLPYLERRLSYYGLDADLDHPHFDLLHFSRRAWGDALPDCQLTTLEREVTGLHRPADIPSSAVPKFYSTYRNTGNPGPLVPIMEHNRQDILTLSELFTHLSEELLSAQT